jgi:hypothetical protein
MLVWPTSTSVTLTFTPPVTQPLGLGVTLVSAVTVGAVVLLGWRRRRDAPSA